MSPVHQHLTVLVVGADKGTRILNTLGGIMAKRVLKKDLENQVALLTKELHDQESSIKRLSIQLESSDNKVASYKRKLVVSEVIVNLLIGCINRRRALGNLPAVFQTKEERKRLSITALSKLNGSCANKAHK